MIPIAIQAHAHGNQHLVRQLVHHSLLIWHERLGAREDLILIGLFRFFDTEMFPEGVCALESSREPDVRTNLQWDPHPSPLDFHILQAGPVVRLDRRPSGDK